MSAGALYNGLQRGEIEVLGIKYEAPLRSGFIILILVVAIGLLITRNYNQVLKAMVQQETRWSTANFLQTSSSHFEMRYTSPDYDQIAMIEGAAEKAYSSVTGIFGREPDKKTTLVVYPDESSLARSFGWDKDEKAMGVYWGGTIRILSPRAYLQDGQVEERFYQEGPMVHEFTHLMVDELSKGNYNRWWTEGVAQYIEKQVTGFEFAAPAKGHYYDLATLEKEFDHLDQRVAYWESLELTEMIVDEYGEDKIFVILEYLGQGMNMQQAIEAGLQVSYNSFEKQLYLRLQG